MANPDGICPACGKSTLKFFYKIGRYRCTDADCGEDFAPTQIQTAPPPLSTATDLLEHLPFPVAYPLAHARDARLPARDRVANAIFAAYQAMRTTALLLLADYLACDTVCRQLQGPIRGLRLPHWYEWSLLCDRLCQFWSGRLREHPERATHFPGLVAGWLEVNRQRKLPEGHPWAELLCVLPGVQGQAARSLNDALWKARNDRAHREATRTLAEGAERHALPRLLSIAEALAERLFPPGALTLWRRVHAASGSPGASGAIRLHGPHLDLCFALDQGSETSALSWGASGLLAATPTADLAVYPLFVPLDLEDLGQALPGGGLIEPVGLVDGIGEKKVVVLGVRSHCERPELAAPIQAALTRKEVQLGYERAQTKPWSLLSWAAVTAGDTLNTLRGRKYFPEVYRERPGVDDQVRAVLDQPGRSLLLLGEAGAGKSSLLARLVDGLLADGGDEGGADAQTYLARRGTGDLVLFLSGAEAYKGDAAWSGRQTLCEAVLRRAGIAGGAFVDLDDLFHHLDATADEDLASDWCVWLILDALNEADRFTDLLRALDDILPSVARYPWLRLVVSLRSGAYHALAQRHREFLQHGSEVLANARFLASFSDARDKDVPYLDLRPFTLEEVATAYALRQRRRPEQSCPVPHDRLEPGLRVLLAQPLYLHLFHETFRGRTVPPQGLDESRLLAAYLDRLELDLPGIATHLARLGKLMVERRSPVLPIAEADAWVAEWRFRLGAENALRVVKLDPVEELVAASLLMRPAEEGEGAERRMTGYGFTQQRLCEQVLLRELRRRIHPRALPIGEELLAWARQADGPDVGEADDFHELTGALETIAAELSLAGRGEVLAALLELEGETVRTRLIGSALRALGQVGRSDMAACERVLEPLFAWARAGTQPGIHLDNSVWQVQRWLTEHGYSPVAGRIATGRLGVLRALVALEPGRADLRRQLSVLLNDLGTLAKASGDGAGARGYFEESLVISRALVAQEPGRVDLRQELSESLNHLGTLAVAAGDGAGARGYFEESLAIRRALVGQEPGRTDLCRNLSVSLGNLGNLACTAGDRAGPGGYGSLAEAAGDRAEARGYFDESLAIMRALVAQEPGRTDLRRDLTMSLENLGRLAITVGDRAGARGYFEESLAIRRALVAQEPGRLDLRRHLATSVSGLGKLAHDAGDGVVARGYYEETLAIMRALVAQEPGRADLHRALSLSLNNLGSLAEAAGDGAGARRYFGESLEISRALVTQEPGRADLRRDLSLFLNNLGTVAEKAGDGVGARRYFEESLAIRRALVAQEPGGSGLRRELSMSLINLGGLAFTAGDEAGARRYFEESLEISRALVAQEPGRADLQHELAIAYFIQHCLVARHDQRHWLEQVLETLRPLREGGMVHGQLDQLWEKATEALRSLNAAD